MVLRVLTLNLRKALLRKKNKFAWVFVVLLTRRAPRGSGTHHPHSERCPLMERAWCTHRKNKHTGKHKEWARNKILYYDTHHGVPGRKKKNNQSEAPICQIVTLISITSARRQQDVFNRGPHQSQKTLSKHINTLLLTDWKKMASTQSKLPLESKEENSLFF